jgi:hypothetical protein
MEQEQAGGRVAGLSQALESRTLGESEAEEWTPEGGEESLEPGRVASLDLPPEAAGGVELAGLWWAEAAGTKHLPPGQPVWDLTMTGVDCRPARQPSSHLLPEAGSLLSATRLPGILPERAFYPERRHGLLR